VYDPRHVASTTQQWTAGAEALGVRLDKFLASPDRLGSRGRAFMALELGKIFVNGAEAGAADAGRRLAVGDVIQLWVDRPGSARRPRIGSSADLDVVYEDDALIVVNKPPGLLSVPLERHPGVPSVFARLEQRLRSHGKRRPLVVHRIDQDTSGLVVFAKDSPSQRHLTAQFARRRPERVYLAVVYGHPSPATGTWRDILVWDTRALIQKETHARDPRGRESIADYRVIERFRQASLVEVHLRTGRRNQIRIQAQLRGYALVGEQRYTDASGPLVPIPFGRQALHASRLEIAHPADGRQLTFEAPIPPDLANLLARLRARGLKSG
jgi:23S rRNA pseudouridine1911/1915/1917 synthase